MSSKTVVTQEEQANINEPSLITSSFPGWNLSQTVPSQKGVLVSKTHQINTMPQF